MLKAVDADDAGAILRYSAPKDEIAAFRIEVFTGDEDIHVGVRLLIGLVPKFNADLFDLGLEVTVLDALTGGSEVPIGTTIGFGGPSF